MHLKAENLAARRGEDLIFVNISFHLEPGEALVLTGRNGSGKSTLLRVVAGLLTAEKGKTIFVDDKGSAERSVAEVSHYFGHRNAMKNELSVAENLTFWRAFLGDSGSGGGSGIGGSGGAGSSSLPVDEAAEAVGLAGITHLPFGYLSAGQQRRLAFAKLLVAHRPVWILDEPTAALDASADILFAELISAHQKAGGIVMAATHQPLGLGNARELAMTGFAGVGEEIWG